MAKSLKEKTVSGAVWSFADNIANSGITFLVGLVLARLLTPTEYGIMAMIAIFIAISISIIDSGFSNALIRKKEVKPIDLNTVFYFNLLISLLLYAILYAAAPLISIFFNEPMLIGVTKVIGLVLIINALGIIPQTILVKNVNFRVQTKVSFISSISSGFLGIIMAYSGCGVWSLVAQQLFRQLLNSSLLWLYSPWLLRLEFSIESFKSMFGFGSKLLISGLIDTIYKNIYYIVIGHYYSAVQLGQYTRAEQFKNIFSSNLTYVFQRVSYPVMSSIQDEPERLKEAYRQLIKVAMLVTFACMLGMAAVAKPLLVILIGKKWLQAAEFLQIICFSGMFYPLHAINLNILQVKGRSDLFLKLVSIRKILTSIPIVLGVFYGIEFMLWGSAITSLLSFFINSYYSANLIEYSAWNQLKDIAPAFLISLFVASCMWGVSFIEMPVYFLFTIQFLLGIVLFIAIYERVKLPEYLEIKKTVLLFVRKFRN